ncbi:MAG TPA: hypothetical protein VHD62_16385 [Opitutaceae bacterium]|nr:hypothetical protein [Opitutaceae bacterium]
MEIPETTVQLLRDEAYAALCRVALSDALAELERDKASVSDTRPPFGVLARKETRETYARSMRAVLDHAADVRGQLSQIEAIEAKLRPLVRAAVAEYLAAASDDYSRFRQILARLHDWERTFQALPEVLLGFARDVRGVRLAATGGVKGVQELAVLREMAARLEQHDRELIIIEQALEEVVTTELRREIRLPVLPDFHYLAWVGKLAAQSVEQIVAETTRVEAEIRRFLADGAETALARLEASRGVCLQLESQFLDTYWAQLRMHARAHYVEERDVDEVLTYLNESYIEAEIVRRQGEISFDPLTALRAT